MKRLMKKSSILIVIVMAILLALFSSYALYSDVINVDKSMKSGIITLSSQLYVNDAILGSPGFSIEPNEIKDVKVVISNAGSNLKVRVKTFVRLQLPANTPLENVKGMYFYDSALSDAAIKSDMALTAPASAITFTAIHQVPGDPVVLQYEVPNSAVAIAPEGTSTVHVKMALANIPSLMYRGIGMSLSSMVVGLQFDHTTDADINSYMPPGYSITTITQPSSTGITLDRSTLSLSGTYTGSIIKATVLPGNCVDRTVTWTSSNPTIASVDQNGIVVSRSTGNTTITAKTSNNFSASCSVTVGP